MHPVLVSARKKNIEILGDIELFLREVNFPIIAITGSNGKSTVTTLVGNMAKESGLKVGIGGNIGIPVLNLLKKSVQLYIIELSSFQLEYIKKLKVISAVVLNLTEDHMDRYPLGLSQYYSVKLKIYNNAKYCIANWEHMFFIQNKFLQNSFITFGLNKKCNYSLLFTKKKNWILINKKKILNINKLKIIGQHNYMNVLASLALADSISIPREKSIKALIKFRGLPHRFQIVHEKKGIRWINDSKSTNVSSTQSALESIKYLNVKGNIWLLLGGNSKMGNFKSLFPYFKNNKVKIYCFGLDSLKLFNLFKKYSIRKNSLEESIKEISKKLKYGDIVLLSPGCSSYDQFENFQHRGNIFTKLAKKF